MRILLKVLALTGLLLTTEAYAVAGGFYMGLMTGPATNSGKEQFILGQPPTSLVPATPKSKQWGSSIYMGYQIGRYAGFEGSVFYFSGINYDTKNIPTCADGRARVRSFNIVGKGIIPFSNEFDVFGKAGVAITYLTKSGALNPSTIPGECGKNEYVTKYLPTLSIGADYALTQSWVVDISYNRLMVGNIVGNMDFLALGLSYHFVDVYCGQFLCD